MKIQYHTDKIWTIEQFLSVDACEELIDLSEGLGYQEAEVSLATGAKMMKSIRNNYRLLYTDFLLAIDYWSKLKDFCPKQMDDSLRHWTK